MYHTLKDARALIARISCYDFMEKFRIGPFDYFEALVLAIHSIADQTLETCSRIKAEPDQEEALLLETIQRIARYTSEETRAIPEYYGKQGHREALTLAWNEATCLIGPRPDLFIFEGDRRLVSLGELYGPATCSICEGEAWDIYVSKEELAGCPWESGTNFIHYVLKRGLGKARCEEHVPKMIKELTHV